jgi:hypothetical protein
MPLLNFEVRQLALTETTAAGRKFAPFRLDPYPLVAEQRSMPVFCARWSTAGSSTRGQTRLRSQVRPWR